MEKTKIIEPKINVYISGVGDDALGLGLSESLKRTVSGALRHISSDIVNVTAIASLKVAHISIFRDEKEAVINCVLKLFNESENENEKCMEPSGFCREQFI